MNASATRWHAIQHGLKPYWRKGCLSSPTDSQASACLQIWLPPCPVLRGCLAHVKGQVSFDVLFCPLDPSFQHDNFTCVRWSHHHHQLSCHSYAVEETSAKHQPVASVHATSPAWKREGAHRRFLSLSLSTLQPGKCATLTSMTATKKILHQDQSTSIDLLNLVHKAPSPNIGWR